MSIEVEATDRVLKARAELILARRFYGVLVSQVEPVLSRKFPTMATNGKQHYFNPEFISALTPQEVLGVQAHESEHDARHHGTRRNGRDPEKWNEACDYAINIDLVDEGFTLPKGALIDPKYRGMSAEDIYRCRELDAEQKQKQQQEPEKDQPGDDGEDGGSDAPKDADDTGEEDGDQGDGGGDAGDDQGEPGDEPGQGAARASPVKATSPARAAPAVTPAGAVKSSTPPPMPARSPIKTARGSELCGKPHRWRKPLGNCRAISLARSSAHRTRRAIGGMSCANSASKARCGSRLGTARIGGSSVAV